MWYVIQVQARHEEQEWTDRGCEGFIYSDHHICHGRQGGTNIFADDTDRLVWRSIHFL